MVLTRYVARLRAPSGALVGRLCDGTPSDVWHVVIIAWPDTVARHADTLAEKWSGDDVDHGRERVIVDALSEETESWCIAALEPAAWRRFEDRCREARRRARGAEEPPPRLAAKPSTPKAPPERQRRGRTGRSIRPAGA